MHQAHLLRPLADDGDEKALPRGRRGRGAVIVASIFLFPFSFSPEQRRPHEQARVDLPESRRGEVDPHLAGVAPDRGGEDEAGDLGA